MQVQISRVRDRADLKEFIRLPWSIYRNDPAWVPPLISEVEKTLDLKKNPFWDHASRELFLARSGGKVVGRIAAIVDRLYQEKFKDCAGHFGFFESVNDGDVSGALFDAVSAWLSERGMKKMCGPMSPSANDECGLLYDGFSTPPYIMMTHNPRYYVDLVERYGFRKSMDWFAYTAERPTDIPRAAIEAAEFARRKLPGLTIRNIDLNDIEHEKAVLKDIYNSAWEDNWGFVPMTDREMEVMIERLKPIAVPELVLFAEVNGEPVGVLALLPNYNEVLKRLNGRLFPFGVFKLLYYSRKIRSLRVIIMGIKKQNRMTGIEAVLFLEAMRRGIARGYTEYESSMILENNVLMRKATELFGGRVYKTYRMYEKEIAKKG